MILHTIINPYDVLFAQESSVSEVIQIQTEPAAVLQQLTMQTKTQTKLQH